jgi:uncharacterized membrane protein
MMTFRPPKTNYKFAYDPNYFQIAEDYEYDGKIVKRFLNFHSYIDAFLWLREQKNPHCYEIILSEKQKVYFDIDITDPNVCGSDVLNDVIRSCMIVLKNNDQQIELSDFLVFSSHTENKISYHIVLNHHCVFDNNQNRYIADKTLNEMMIENQKYLDISVYTSMRCFRLLGSSKYGKTNTKILQLTNNLNDKLVKTDIRMTDDERRETRSHALRYFEASLVTFTDACKQLSVRSHIKEIQVVHKADISPEIFEKYEKFARENNLSDVYEISTCKFNIISLKRVRPAECVICKRQHDSDGAYLAIYSQGVRFRCRRNEKDSILL